MYFRFRFETDKVRLSPALSIAVVQSISTSEWIGRS